VGVRISNSKKRASLGLLFVTIAFFGSISTISAQGASKPKPSAEQVAKANITYEVISVEAGGYGYDVFVDGKKLIHQTNIPGQPGVAGFRKKEDSRRVAELVIRKLKNKELPPSVTEDELRQLKVIE
jgi:hypothetical protein